MGPPGSWLITETSKILSFELFSCEICAFVCPLTPCMFCHLQSKLGCFGDSRSETSTLSSFRLPLAILGAELRALIAPFRRQVPSNFRFVVEQTLREFFKAIQEGRDAEQSWKKSIYKIISRLDDPVPEYFKSPNFLEQLEWPVTNGNPMANGNAVPLWWEGTRYRLAIVSPRPH